MASKTSDLVTLTKVVKNYTEFCFLEFHVRNWLEANVGAWIRNKHLHSEAVVEATYRQMGGAFTADTTIHRSLVIGEGWKLVNSFSRMAPEFRGELFLQLEWTPDVIQLKLKHF